MRGNERACEGIEYSRHACSMNAPCKKCRVSRRDRPGRKGVRLPNILTMTIIAATKGVPPARREWSRNEWPDLRQQFSAEMLPFLIATGATHTTQGVENG